jgi:uncharacterized membrane protein YkoI
MNPFHRSDQMQKIHRTIIAVAAAAAISPAGAQVTPTSRAPIAKEPMTTTTTTTTSLGDVQLTPWKLTPEQFAADLEPVPVPTGCAARINRADVSRIAIKTDLYRAGMISPDSAKFLALCAIPGQVTSGEMHAENGRTMYEVSLIPDRRSTNAKVIIDANTGEVLSSKTYGGLRGLAGFLRENVERQENKNPAALDTLNMRQPPPQAGTVCTMEARPAVQVTVEDENGMRITASGVRVKVSDAAYSDSTVSTVSTVAAATGSFALGYERPGTYRIEVNAPGYAPAVLTDIVVAKTADGCHVATRQLTARLHR